MKKLISALLSMSLILGLIPFGALNASADPVTATSDQKTWQVEDDGGHTDIAFHTGSGSNIFTYEDIQIFKTIEPVIKDGAPVENYFDITLKLSSPPHTHAHSTNVVLVMDISNTMNYEHDGSEPESGEQSRLDEAKDAAKAFATTFCSNATNGATHKLGIVTFNTNATNFMPLTPAENTATSKTNFTDKIGTITAPATPDGNRFTNIEGGLQLAYNILEDSNVTGQKYIILLTDGFPTTYIEGDKTSTASLNGYRPLANSDTDPRDTVFHDHVLNRECNEGTNYSEVGAIHAQNVAATIKADADNYKIFSIGLDIGGQSIANYIAEDVNESYSTIDRPSTANGNYAIEIDPPDNTKPDYKVQFRDTTDYVKYGNWLAYKIATPAETKNNKDYLFFWHADNTEGHKLSNIFPAIIDEMASYTSAPFRAATVIDPMGTNIEFIGMFNKDGTLVKPVSTADNLKNVELVGVYGDMNANPPAGENDVSFNYAAKTVEGVNYTNGYIEWDPVNSGWYRDGTHTDGRPIYSMSLKYRVRLKNEVSGFTEDNAPSDSNYTAVSSTNPYPTNLTAKDHETNGTTTFTFIDNDHDVTTEKFPIPVVEGYLGELEFTKLNASDNNNPMGGVEFTLTHKGSDCSVCKAAGNTVTISSVSITSGPDGKVKFENIPSGHEYILSETGVPVDYKKMADKTVTVAYNTVTVTEPFDNTSGSNNLPNEKLDPVNVALAVKKEINHLPTNRPFKFELYYKDPADNNNLVPVEEQTTGTDGKIVFNDLTFGPDEKLKDGAPVNSIPEIFGLDLDPSISNDYEEFFFVIREILPEVDDTDPAWQEDILYNNAALGDIDVNIKLELNDTQTAYVATIDYDTSGNDISELDDYLFVNNANRPSVKLPLTVNKNVIGTHSAAISDINPYADINGIGFTFNLYDEDRQLIANKTATGNAGVTFEPTDIPQLVFNHSDNYVFYIEEVADPTIHQIVYDDTIYRIDVTVPRPVNADGTPDNASPYTISEVVISTTSSVGGEKGDTVATYTLENNKLVINSINNENIAQSADANGNISVSFENRERREIKVPITILKSFDGAKPGNRLFKFKFTDENGNVQYITNDSNGDVWFANPAQDNDPATDDIYLFQRVYGGEGEKTYTYQVQEWEYMDTPNEKLVYDYSVYEIIIDISAPNKKGEESYQADVTIEKSNLYKSITDADYARYTVKAKYDSVNDVFVYSNVPAGNGGKYNPVLTFANKTREPASVYFSARKTLNFHKPGENDVFNFILIDATSGNDVEIREKTNDGYGVDFGSISYNSSGKRTYKVYERSGNDEKVTYDKSLYTIVVDVTVDITSDAPFKAHTTLYRNGELHTDDNVPTFKNFKYDIPNTGDISNIALYGIIAAISGIALIVIVRKKRRNSDN